MIVRLIVTFAVVAAAGGCLPRGEPPRGQQLLPGRGDDVVIFQSGPVGEPARLLALRPSATPGPPGFAAGGIVDVFVVSAYDPVTGQTRLEPLFDSAVVGSVLSGGPAFEVDARGRLFFLRAILGQPASPSEPATLRFERVRFDPATGAGTDCGIVSGALVGFLSRDRTLVLVGRDSEYRVLDLDDRETLLPAASVAGFVGNDVYFIAMNRDLFRLRGTDLAAAPELAAHDVVTFSAIDTARGALLLLERAPVVPTGQRERVLFDPATSAEIGVPGATEPSFNQPFVVPSPTGKYLLVQPVSDEGQAQAVTLYDRDTNTAETLADLRGEARWRPGHDEAWLQAELDTGGAAVWRWRPGEALVHLTDGGLATSFDISEHTFAGAPFTPDGDFWLSREPEGVVALRSITDSAFAPLALNPVGTGVSGYLPLPDGRAISEVYTTYPFHCDISLVDPQQRVSTLIASNGHVVRVGEGRMLTLLNWVKTTFSGDLTLVDISTGAQTLLAENVFGVAIEPSPSGLDPLATGTRIAYLVRSRIASPYDGLWVTTLP